jgi:hypothetical protein
MTLHTCSVCAVTQRPHEGSHVLPQLTMLRPLPVCVWPVLCWPGGSWTIAATLPVAAVHIMQVTGRYTEFLCIVSGPRSDILQVHQVTNGMLHFLNPRNVCTR